MTSATGLSWAAGGTLPPRAADVPLHTAPLRARSRPHRTAVSISACRVYSFASAASFSFSAVASEEAAASSSSTEEEVVISDEEEAARGKEGARVRVTAPLKVYHVPKVEEVEMTGREGVVKQYVGIWKGKRISANFPFKVEFRADLPGRGNVKFFVHLREDEFEIIDQSIR